MDSAWCFLINTIPKGPHNETNKEKENAKIFFFPFPFSFPIKFLQIQIIDWFSINLGLLEFFFMETKH